MHTIAVVLAGGVGTRLYPASSRARPKQFLSLDGEQSLLTRTVERARECADEVCCLTRPEYESLVREHAPEATVLTEPVGRDTGPALVYAAHTLQDRADVLLCLPSDHHVGDGFPAVARRACAVAHDTDRLVTLGIEPTRAATEYGYIRPGAPHDDGAWYVAERFTEKPDAATAARFREQGYRWNAGIFAWTPDALLGAASDAALGAFVAALDDDPDGAFRDVDPISIDYAVLEQSSDIAVVPADVEWDDLGSWDALRRVLPADDEGNVVHGNALAIDSEECVVATDEDTHVSVVGMDGVTVAAYDGRVVVVPTSQAQRVKAVVNELRERGEWE